MEEEIFKDADVKGILERKLRKKLNDRKEDEEETEEEERGEEGEINENTDRFMQGSEVIILRL